MSAASVELTGIGFSYGQSPVLEDVTFRVDRGDFFGIIGPNGAGKTTLLRVMLGLLTPTQGSARLFGVPPAELRDWGRVGYVPQKTFLDSTLPMTAGEVVASGLVSRLRPFRRVGWDGRGRVLEALALVGMEKHVSARVGRLSAGQQQRVLIARALASRPELLLLDEPAGGVDPEAQVSLYRLLRRLNVEDSVSVVLVSHDIGVVAKEVNRLACLNGSMVFCGSPASFLGHESLARLYGSGVRVVRHHDPCPHAS